ERSDIEPLTVANSSSSITTTIYNAVTNQPISGTQLPGTTVYDTSTVTGGTIAPTGTVTYEFFTNGTASGTPVYERTFVLGSNSDPQGPLGGGDYSFVAFYSGDSNYGSSTSSVEPLTISKLSPTINTTPGGTVVVGSGVPLTDSATLAGGYNP